MTQLPELIHYGDTAVPISDVFGNRGDDLLRITVEARGIEIDWPEVQNIHLAPGDSLELAWANGVEFNGINEANGEKFTIKASWLRAMFHAG
jgi:hypothetical protein